MTMAGAVDIPPEQCISQCSMQYNLHRGVTSDAPLQCAKTIPLELSASSIKALHDGKMDMMFWSCFPVSRTIVMI